MNTQNETKAAHTPLPWITGDDATVYGPRMSIDGQGRQIGTFQICDCKGYKSEREANSNYIVHCVNTHAELVAALEELLADPYLSDPINADRMANARIALAKAKGEGQT